jgi:hypothetical protein
MGSVRLTLFSDFMQVQNIKRWHSTKNEHLSRWHSTKNEHLSRHILFTARTKIKS